MSNLLKFARARDDQNFIWRIGAAMMVRAQEIRGWDLPTPSRSLVTWVYANPMNAPAHMVNFCSTNASLAASMSVENGVVDTNGISDNDLQFVVNESWDQVAGLMFSSTTQSM